MGRLDFPRPGWLLSAMVVVVGLWALLPGEGPRDARAIGQTASASTLFALTFNRADGSTILRKTADGPWQVVWQCPRAGNSDAVQLFAAAGGQDLYLFPAVEGH